MKKLLLIIFTSLIFISCKEEPVQVLKNQEVEIVFVGYRNAEKITHNNKDFYNREYAVDVEWNGVVQNVAYDYLRPQNHLFEVGQKRLAYVYLYRNGEVEIRLK